jgi:hypothetical protein
MGCGCGACESIGANTRGTQSRTYVLGGDAPQHSSPLSTVSTGRLGSDYEGEVTSFRYRLQAAPGSDTETEEYVDQLNDTIQGGPDEDETWHDWSDRVQDIIDRLHGPDWVVVDYWIPDGDEVPYSGYCGDIPGGTESSCELSDDDRADAERAIGFGEFAFIGGWSAEEKEFMIDAFAYLQNNSDLVEYLVCAYFGLTAKAYMSEFLLKGGMEVDFRKGSDTACNAKTREAMYVDANVWAGSGEVKSNNVYVCESTFQGWFDDYRCGTSAQRTTAALNVAVSIAHELAHLCSDVGHASDEWIDGIDRVNAFEAALGGLLLQDRCGLPWDNGKVPASGVACG